VGNVDEGETAIQTALREAEEELGEPIPNYDIKNEVVSTRGKEGDKIFAVFLVQISPRQTNFPSKAKQRTRRVQVVFPLQASRSPESAPDCRDVVTRS